MHSTGGFSTSPLGMCGNVAPGVMPRCFRLTLRIVHHAWITIAMPRWRTSALSPRRERDFCRRRKGKIYNRGAAAP
jgi:hypothetical protein